MEGSVTTQTSNQSRKGQGGAADPFGFPGEDAPEAAEATQEQWSTEKEEDGQVLGGTKKQNNFWHRM